MRNGSIVSILLMAVFMAVPARAQDLKATRPGGLSVESLRLDRSRPGRYARSLRAPDGTIHLLGIFRVIENGTRVVLDRTLETGWGEDTFLSEAEVNTFFSRPGLVIGLRNRVEPAGEGRFFGRMWRSFDDLESVRGEETTVIIPEAGEVDTGSAELWAGIFFHRAVVELGDGSLLAAMYGNFEQDTLRPTHPWSRTESKYKLRAFCVRSEDLGETWRYVTSVAVPRPDRPDGSEGFNEWTIARLGDGRLLGIIRTGHFTPMVAVWSADEGKSWTAPRPMPELGPAGVDPCLIRLRDGRLALAYGQMAQPPAESGAYWKDFETRGDTRRKCRLAVSTDRSGEEWRTYDISGYGNRSAYPTIFEVEPGIILYQADLELWRVELPPR